MKIGMWIAVSFFLLQNLSAATKSPEIKSIKGSVFYHTKGTWSKNIFDEGFNIWNAVIGEGSLKGPTNQTLFMVETNGAEGYEVKFSVVLKGQKKVIYKKKKELEGFLVSSGKSIFVPFLVPNTSYGTYIVKAKIVNVLGETQGKPITKSIRFDGGE